MGATAVAPDSVTVGMTPPIWQPLHPEAPKLSVVIPPENACAPGATTTTANDAASMTTANRRRASSMTTLREVGDADTATPAAQVSMDFSRKWEKDPLIRTADAYALAQARSFVPAGGRVSTRPMDSDLALGRATVLSGAHGGKYPHGNSLLVAGTEETVLIDPSLS